MPKEGFGVWSVKVDHDEMEKAVREFLIDAASEAEECDAPSEVVKALNLCVQWFGVPHDLH